MKKKFEIEWDKRYYSLTANSLFKLLDDDCEVVRGIKNCTELPDEEIHMEGKHQGLKVEGSGEVLKLKEQPQIEELPKLDSCVGRDDVEANRNKINEMLREYGKKLNKGYE